MGEERRKFDSLRADWERCQGSNARREVADFGGTWTIWWKKKIENLDDV